MFYAHFVLSKRGPLAKIWLAAHWDKKLTKAHVFETNIDSSVEAIIKPKVKMALRTSGHLLLGVVRIYSRKAKYLLADCNEAFVKIKMAFRPGVVDLPEENREAAVATITLPETFHDFDTTMADLNDIDVQAQFSVNQSRPEEITMREDLGNITLIGDDGFGDMGFDDREMLRDPTIDDSLYKTAESSAMLLDNTLKDSTVEKPMDLDFPAPGKEDDFSALPDEPLYADDDGGAESSDDDNDFGGGDLFGDDNFMDGGGLFEEPVPEPALAPVVDQEKQHLEKEVDPFPAAASETIVAPEQTTVMRDQTTLVQNENEAFALEPLDITSIGTERKTKRKRKLIVDDHKGIPSETMKMQLSDTSDIVTTLDLAPPTKKLMHWKETGGVEKLFALPGRAIISKRINRLFVRNLITRPTDDDDEQEDDLVLAPEVPREEPPHPQVEEPVPEEIQMPALEESRTELAPPTPLPAEVSTRPTRHSELSIAPETPKPVRQPSPEPDENNDDLFMDNLEGHDNLALPEEEQQKGGDVNEVEDKRWSKRTHQMMHTVSRALTQTEVASFNDLVRHNNRKQVAAKFYTFLVLKKQQAVELQQMEHYGDIWITKGPKFEEVY